MPCYVFFLATFSAIFVAVIESQKLPPAILIPGVGGSRFQAKLDRNSSAHFFCHKKAEIYTLWFNVEFLVPVLNLCWLDNIKLEYDVLTRKTSSRPGVEIIVPGFGDPQFVEWLDEGNRLVGYFKDLGNALVDMGYVRNVSLRGAPYDFRKGPTESGGFFENLQKLVEDTYKLNSGSKVALISHSMGSQMAAIFLRKQPQAWKDKYVECWISLNGVLAGSVKGLKTYVVGDNLNEFFTPTSVLKELQTSSPSLALLVPYRQVWGDKVLVETPFLNYSLANIEQFFIDSGNRAGWEMRQDQLPYLTLEPPNVEVHCLYGTEIPTIDGVKYKKQDDFPGYPTYTYGTGDGTVNLESLSYCRRWKREQTQPVHVREYPKVDHSQIIKDRSVHDYIADILWHKSTDGEINSNAIPV
ncbi:O-acyltransferase activity [Nesidiocoris tenuis]|uniref:O-acyltransferase activity n=1 Tax=Nesidiocoris tenuis TaxID=355587 RepID=A0ABN7BHE0_9HEMI|nr:O-acyltransferase activity [Nesidiocoris tenuis]